MLILTSTSSFVTKHFVHHLPKKPKDTKLTFIPTAAEVENGDLQWLKDDRQALVSAGFQVTDFTVTGKEKKVVQNMLEHSDIVFVSGGNTFFLLQEMKRSGFVSLIHQYVDKGLIYVGSSAGSVVAGPNISLVSELDDPALAPDLSDYKGLHLTDVSIFPHWGSEQFHKRYEKVMRSGYKKGNKTILLTDDQYLLITKDKYTIYSI